MDGWTEKRRISTSLARPSAGLSARLSVYPSVRPSVRLVFHVVVVVVVVVVVIVVVSEVRLSATTYLFEINKAGRQTRKSDPPLFAKTVWPDIGETRLALTTVARRRYSSPLAMEEIRLRS